MTNSAPTPRYPSLLEINTRVWLRRLSCEAGKPITLANVDDDILDDIARRGFDWIWLLSVWRTGAASRAVSRSLAAWQAEFRAALPDLTQDDICGSGFAIGAYEVDVTLGGKAALAAFRARPAACGSCLISCPIIRRSIIPGSGSIQTSISRAARMALPQSRRTGAGSTPI